MRTLIEVTKLASLHLAKKGVSRRDVEDLIASMLELKRIDLYTQHDRPLTESELGLIRRAIERLSKGEPYAYIVGKVDFLDLEILVNPSVLIPRVETELWVS
ncbi:MAG: peptide chain release factor N(5)-glutamine methyltransferase, partial [Parachlamydiaceae bacterium]